VAGLRSRNERRSETYDDLGSLAAFEVYLGLVMDLDDDCASGGTIAGFGLVCIRVRARIVRVLLGYRFFAFLQATKGDLIVDLQDLGSALDSAKESRASGTDSYGSGRRVLAAE
jgi:hypothetical protein